MGYHVELNVAIILVSLILRWFCYIWQVTSTIQHSHLELQLAIILTYHDDFDQHDFSWPTQLLSPQYPMFETRNMESMFKHEVMWIENIIYYVTFYHYMFDNL